MLLPLLRAQTDGGWAAGDASAPEPLTAHRLHTQQRSSTKVDMQQLQHACSTQLEVLQSVFLKHCRTPLQTVSAAPAFV